MALLGDAVLAKQAGFERSRRARDGRRQVRHDELGAAAVSGRPPATPRYVAVIGPGDAPEGGELAEAAEAVGRALAERGAVVVCGGLGGVMAAACRGVAAAGGTSVGLLPGTDRAAANPWVTIALPTGLGEARNACVVVSADAVVAVGGGYGTLSEIALALRSGMPVVGLRTWAFDLDGGLGGVHRVASAGEAVDLALALAEAPG